MDDITKRMNNWDGKYPSNDALFDDDLFADAPPLKRCDGCGKYVEENLLKKCRVCGKYFCPVCRQTHDCRIKTKPTEYEQHSENHIHEEVPPVREQIPVKEKTPIEVRTETKTVPAAEKMTQTVSPPPAVESIPTNSASPAKKETISKPVGGNKELRIRLHGSVFFWPIVWICISFILFIVLGFGYLIFIPICLLIIAIILLIADLIKYCTEYLVITPTRVYGKNGLVEKDRVNIMVDKIDGVEVNRKLRDFIFGTGNLTICSIGGRHTKTLGPVGKPYKLQELISEYVWEYQNKH
ncbi:MAG TPA: PH domain-containing protein [Methanocorpusculum sp.]|nr:PH domain-containing protein [Methanocorpusculum sp.]